MGALDDLIEAGDLNGLLRAVDALCEQRGWDELLDLADRCEEALERGKQLWPISAHIDYRIALEAPPHYAAQILDPETGRFALGPLTEVAASTHSWDELAPHLEHEQTAAYVAQERVLRGEVLTGDERAHPEILELPLRLEEWEPTYALATYRSSFFEVAEPWEPRAPMEEVGPGRGREIEDPDLTTALLDLVAPWTAESNGAARAVAVEGGGRDAAVAVSGDVARVGELTLQEALRLMAWAAASGGAHGRRRGAALGRSMSWYVGTLAAGLSWPPDPAELGAALGGLRWYRWEERNQIALVRTPARRGLRAEDAAKRVNGELIEGWSLRLAVEDPADGWAAAVAATDVLDATV